MIHVLTFVFRLIVIIAIGMPIVLLLWTLSFCLWDSQYFEYSMDTIMENLFDNDK